MLSRLRKSIAKRFDVIADTVGLAISLSGASVAFVLGKFVLAVVFGAFACGVFLRLKGRKSRGVVLSQRPPSWIKVCSAVLSVIACGLLVEAVNLPVRFNQDGFSILYWVLVLLVLYFGVSAFAIVLSKIGGLLATRKTL
jgi:hypothetical protein